MYTSDVEKIPMYSDDLETVKKAIASGADVDQEDFTGFTPLMNALYNGEVEIARLLLKHGADPTKRHSGGNSVIDFAMQTRDDSIIKEIGVLLDAKNALKYTEGVSSQ